METLFVYLIKSGALIATFWLAYYLLLRKETFFKSNRWYLLFGLVASVILPLVTFKKMVLVEAVKLVDWQSATTAVTTTVTPEETFEINWFMVFAAVYGIGLIAFLLRFFTDLYSLKQVLRGQKVSKQADFKFVDTSANISPFSYFNYIVFNSSLYSAAELENILEHEKVHSNQNHTLDVLFARLFCIVFWFNPFVWFYKKSILQNLEFIADNEATKNLADKRSYQITLLKVTAHENCVAITNHFYQSLIKKRIVMLNKNQSKKRNSWKYFFIVPVLAAFMFYFQVEVVAQQKNILLEDGSTVSPSSREVTDMTWTKNTTDAEFKNLVTEMKKSGVNFKFSNIKRNANGEIVAIKISYKDKLGNEQTKKVSGNEPIAPIRFVRDMDFNGKGKIGFYESNNQIFVKGYKIRSGEEDNATGDDGDEGRFEFTLDPEDAIAIEVPEIPEFPEVPEVPEIPEINSSTKSIMITKGNGKPIIIVDGKRISEEEMEKLDPETFKHVRIANNDKSVKGYTYNYNYNKSGTTRTIVIDAKKISREATENARESMKKARIEIERARPEIELSKPEIERARLQIEASKPEIERAKKEIEAAREEIRKARLEIEKSKADLKKEKAAAKK